MHQPAPVSPNVVLCWKDVTYTCKYMRHNQTIVGISSVQWWKVGRNWKLQMYFRRLLCIKIKIDQLYCVNCWIIIYCLSVNCTKINYSCYALMIWSSLQLTSKRWINTQQFTARADLFFFIFLKSAGPSLEHSRTVLNYIHRCEGRFFKQVKNILSGLEGWSSAEAALEGIKRWCCNCGDRQRVPEMYCWGKEGALVGIHGAVRYQESGPVASGCCAGMC